MCKCLCQIIYRIYKQCELYEKTCIVMALPIPQTNVKDMTWDGVRGRFKSDYRPQNRNTVA